MRQVPGADCVPALRPRLPQRARRIWRAHSIRAAFMSGASRPSGLMPGEVVAVPAAVAAQLIELAGFHALRIQARGTASYLPLKALYEAGLMKSVPSNGTTTLLRR